ncbi:MAG: molecular chaperone TorD family protein [Gammaproteobacteria bacterium]|nr:molecular chaperone TorD family protein [Gammaproteobacteria bacterium]
MTAAGGQAALRSAAYRRLAELFRYPGAAGSGGREADAGPIGSDYLQAFEPAVSERACSLRESAHSSAARDAVHEDLVRFYGHFGLRRNEDAELPDHLTVELEFMHFLTHLEQRAQERGEPVADLRRAQRDFLQRHVQRLAQRVAAAYRADNAYYRELIEELHDFVDRDLQRLEQHR